MYRSKSSLLKEVTLNIDNLISTWAQERLAHGSLAADADSSAQVSDAVTELRKNLPKSVEDIDKWASAKFMNAPPLTHNTQAVNQVNAAVTDLKTRLTDVFVKSSPVEPKSPPSPPVAASNKE